MTVTGGLSVAADLDLTSLRLTRSACHAYDALHDRPVRLAVSIDRFPLAQAFAISRGAKTEAVVVTCEIMTLDGTHAGRGECVPYARYGETPTATAETISACAPHNVPSTIGSLECAARTLPPGAAANALDCALWDLFGNLRKTSVRDLIGLPPARPIATFATVSLDTPEAMADAARAYQDQGFQQLKLKLGGEDDPARLRATRAAVPNLRLIADANEGCVPDQLSTLLATSADVGLALLEQPLPADHDEALAMISRAVPVCADESVHAANSIAALVDRYDSVNIKLDKTGGLTGALAAIGEARRLGLGVMLGSMVSSSLSMAPAAVAATLCDDADLDSPALLARDRTGGMAIRDGHLLPAPEGLWGG